VSDERLLETFFELVRIDSPSGEEAQVAAYCEAALKDLGMDVKVDGAAYEAESDTGNLIATLPGTVAGKTIVLCAHMDTVEPGRGIEPVLEDGVVRSAGATILGGDDKSGIAAILECLRRTIETGAQHAPVRVVFTVGEEMGLRGAKQLEPADVAGDLCVVLDADGEPGGIVTAAPTHYTFTATFHGHAAHAGVEPEKGRSAIQMAANAISSMRLGRLDPETTANVGSITGGGRTNVVAASCTITGECRSLDRERVDAVKADMDAALNAAAAAKGGSVTVTWRLEYEGFRFDETDPLVTLVERSASRVGLTPRRFETGGGSDGNVLSAKGVPTLVLASGLSDVHGTNESMRVQDLQGMVALLMSLLEEACE
jgi:tripeptide aminopeptidase